MAGFDELMPKTLDRLATVDRLMRHVHACQTTGDSIRLSQAVADLIWLSSSKSLLEG